MAPKDGKALMLLSLSAEKSLPKAADAFLEQFQLQQTGRQNKQVNGLPATVIQAQQVDQQSQQVIKVMAYLIQYNGTVYQLLGMAYQQDFTAYSSRFQTTMEGFKKLTDASKINVKPERIKIVQVSKASRFQDVLKANGIPSNRYEELAILNSMQLNTQVPKGELIKVVEKK